MSWKTFWEDEEKTSLIISIILFIQGIIYAFAFETDRKYCAEPGDTSLAYCNTTFIYEGDYTIENYPCQSKCGAPAVGDSSNGFYYINGTKYGECEANYTAACACRNWRTGMICLIVFNAISVFVNIASYGYYGIADIENNVLKIVVNCERQHNGVSFLRIFHPINCFQSFLEIGAFMSVLFTYPAIYVDCTGNEYAIDGVSVEFLQFLYFQFGKINIYKFLKTIEDQYNDKDKSFNPITVLFLFCNSLLRIDLWLYSFLFTWIQCIVFFVGFVVASMAYVFSFGHWNWYGSPITKEEMEKDDNGKMKLEMSAVAKNAP